jgi:hypothetical protein
MVGLPRLARSNRGTPSCRQDRAEQSQQNRRRPFAPSQSVPAPPPFSTAYPSCVPSAIDQHPDKLQQRLLFETVRAISEEFPMGVYLSTRAEVRLMFDDRLLESRVACQRPAIAVAASYRTRSVMWIQSRPKGSVPNRRVGSKSLEIRPAFRILQDVARNVAPLDHSPARKGGKLGGKASDSRPASEHSRSAKKAANAEAPCGLMVRSDNRHDDSGKAPCEAAIVGTACRSQSIAAGYGSMTAECSWSSPRPARTCSRRRDRIFRRPTLTVEPSIRAFDRIASFAAFAFVIGPDHRLLPPHRATTLRTSLRWR